MHFAALALPVVTHASFQVDMTLKFRTNIHKRRQLISGAHDMVQIGRKGNTSKATTASRPAGLIWQSITQYPQRSGISTAAQNRGHRWLDWLRIWLSKTSHSVAFYRCPNTLSPIWSIDAHVVAGAEIKKSGHRCMSVHRCFKR